MKINARQVNVMMSNEVADLLDEIAKATGLSKVAVLEMCVNKHAVTIPEIRDKAEKAFIDILTKSLGKSVNSKDFVHRGK